MKKFLFLIVAFFSIQMVSGQEATNVSDNKVYRTSEVEIKPEFVGGIQNFYEFVGNNYQLPDIMGLKGNVYITLIVEKDGSLSDIRVLRDLGNGTGEEAIRVLKKCPKWIPAQHKGIKVRCSYSLPITLQTK